MFYNDFLATFTTRILCFGWRMFFNVWVGEVIASLVVLLLYSEKLLRRKRNLSATYIFCRILITPYSNFVVFGYVNNQDQFANLNQFRRPN